MWTTTTAFKDYTRVEGHFISSEGALHWETRSIAGSKTEITLFWISPTHTQKKQNMHISEFNIEDIQINFKRLYYFSIQL